MDIDKPQAPKGNGKQEKKHPLKWLREHLHTLWQDIRTETRNAKFWLEIGALGAACWYGWVAWHQWQAQIDAMKIDERAWVSVDVGEKVGKFAVTMKNTGKTPALNVIYFAAFEGGPRGVIPDIPNPKTQRIYHFLVAPGDSRAADDWEVNYLQAFNLGGDRNYVQGDIAYDDIFGETHHTIYCYWTEPPQVRQPGVFPPSTFVMCGDHNKMD